MTDIVIDVGSATWPGEESLRKLRDRFRPRLIYAFDPAETDSVYALSALTTVVAKRAGAWVSHDPQPFWFEGARTRRVEGHWMVPCFDLARFIQDLPQCSIVLKLDCEGSEYRLLNHLHEQGADVLLDGILVEWHGPPLDLQYRCPVELWT